MQLCISLYHSLYNFTTSLLLSQLVLFLLFCWCQPNMVFNHFSLFCPILQSFLHVLILICVRFSSTCLIHLFLGLPLHLLPTGLHYEIIFQSSVLFHPHYVYQPDNSHTLYKLYYINLVHYIIYCAIHLYSPKALIVFHWCFILTFHLYLLLLV